MDYAVIFSITTNQPGSKQNSRHLIQSKTVFVTSLMDISIERRCNVSIVAAQRKKMFFLCCHCHTASHSITPAHIP